MNPENKKSPSPEATEVVDFWRQAGPEKWFSKDDAFDDEFQRRFTELHMRAARVEFDAWMNHPESALALFILLDQFPRNCFRGTGHMYATDPLALSYARQTLESGMINNIEPEMRRFALLPFTHSEDPADHELSVKLSYEHSPDSVKWSLHHQDIIKTSSSGLVAFRIEIATWVAKARLKNRRIWMRTDLPAKPH